MFATAPESGGSIYEKTSPLSSISFTPGLGTPVIKDADGSGEQRHLDEAERELPDGARRPRPQQQHGLLPLHRRWAEAGAGAAHSLVHRVAHERGRPAHRAVHGHLERHGHSRAWDFQNDGIVDSTAPNPSFTYTTPNTYTAKLTVTNAAGSSSATRTITVSPPGGGGSSLTFMPTDDAYVRPSHPNENAGADTSLRVLKRDRDTQSYLKFTVGGVTGPVNSVKLRLFVTDASAVSGGVHAVATRAGARARSRGRPNPPPGHSWPGARQRRWGPGSSST